MIEKRLSTQVTATGIRNLQANTNITFFGQGSIVRTLIETMASEVESLYDSIDLNLAQVRLDTASGVFLDLIASQFGLTRLPGGTGTILAEDKVVRFFVTEGRLVDYLTNSNPTTGIIPSGTQLYASSGNLIYQVPDTVTFPANASQVWVPVTPSDTSRGARNNVPAGALSSHSLGNAAIQVENLAALITGSNVESDDEFRLRISRHVNSKVTGSRAAILQAAFAFPGVSDIQIANHKYGAGSFEILVVPATARLPENVIQRIKTAVSKVVPFGIRVEVKGPTIVPVSLVLSIDMRSGGLAQTKDTALRAVRDAITNYLGNIPMGGEIVMNRIVSTALEAHSGIRDVSVRQFAVECRPQVIANYRLRADEIFDLDRKLAEPILVV